MVANWGVRLARNLDPPQSESAALTPSPAPTGSPAPTEKKSTGAEHQGLLLLYVVLVVAFVTALHVVDAVQAYQISRRQSAAILNKLPTSLSPRRPG